MTDDHSMSVEDLPTEAVVAYARLLRRSTVDDGAEHDRATLLRDVCSFLHDATGADVGMVYAAPVDGAWRAVGAPDDLAAALPVADVSAWLERAGAPSPGHVGRWHVHAATVGDASRPVGALLIPSAEDIPSAMLRATIDLCRSALRRPAVHPGLDRVARSLRGERDLLARIFETSPVAITVLDTRGNIKRANARAEEVLGLTPSDLQKRSYDDPGWKHTTVEGDPLPDAAQPFRMVKETNAPVYDVRHGIEWPNGRRRVLSINGAPLQAADGSLTGAVFVVEDVTDEYQRRRTARERQSKVRALYEAMSRLLQLGSFESVADRMLSLIEDTMGYEISAIRLRVDDVLRPTSVTQGVKNTMSQPRPDYPVDGDSIVARAYRIGETLAFADVREAGDRVDRGRVRSAAYIPIGVFGTISVGTTVPGGIDAFDVQLIEILARNAETVMRRLADEAELREARDVAEEASRLKSAMLANMSHEVRTPLTSILGFAEVIEKETTEESTRIFARRVRVGSLRLRDTLDSVLHLSRLEAEALTPATEPVDVLQEVKDTCDELAPLAEESGVTLSLDVLASTTTCETDPFAIQRILRNVIGNAIKFTPSGGSVDVTVAAGEGGFVVDVVDTGIGMSEAFQRRMFDAFTQESEGIRREHEGSGLGLAIVRKLLDLIHGQIEVESTPKFGTRMSIYLPATLEHAASGPSVQVLPARESSDRREDTAND
ncbi:PAS domain-containing sensor histidine kinase [Longibacter sp.]|uniref:PAS domain-containing sensor histidine kinase n=1 Tax=Longibacter sp. TaxID=2045415 RepID=UPI003EBCF8C7